jgi:hypothetical protein
VHKKTKFVIKVEANKKGKKSNKGGKQDLHKSGKNRIEVEKIKRRIRGKFFQLIFSFHLREKNYFLNRLKP